MKFKHLVMGLALPLFATNAFADQFYIDNGADFGGNNNYAVDGNTTGWLTELTYAYQSNSTVDCSLATLFGGATCDISTSGGVVTDQGMSAFSDSIVSNIVTGFLPRQIGSAFGPSDNDYGDTWALTFDFDVEGVINGTNLSVDYDSGSVTFYYVDLLNPSPATLVELFTLDVFATQISSGGPALYTEFASFGSDSINGVSVDDMFNFAGKSFGDYVAEMVRISASLDFNTDPDQADFADNGNGTSSVSGRHDGSISFAVVPEPSTIAFMGLGLFAMGAYSRRKKA